MFGIRRHPNPSLCPVKAIETYIAVSAELGMTLRNGYLFRPTNAQGHVVNKQFTSSSAKARLRLYLKETGLDEGETLHSFRSGLSTKNVDLNSLKNFVSAFAVSSQANPLKRSSSV